MQKVRRSEVRETVEGFKSRIFDYRSRLTDYSHPVVTSLFLPFITTYRISHGSVWTGDKGAPENFFYENISWLANTSAWNKALSPPSEPSIWWPLSIVSPFLCRPEVRYNVMIQQWTNQNANPPIRVGRLVVVLVIHGLDYERRSKDHHNTMLPTKHLTGSEKQFRVLQCSLFQNRD